MRKSAVQLWASGAVVEQGLDLAAQVSATASEAVRTRKEPALVARRRQRAARRRVKSWSAASIATAAGGAGLVAITGGLSTGVIIGLVVLSAVLVMCVVRAVRAAADLRSRTRVVNALPPPSPRRSAVVAELRPVMARLDGYSDGLRRLVGLVGLIEDATVRSMRDDVIRSADATEQRLRGRAADLSELIRTRRRASADVAGGLDATIAGLRQEIEGGVAAYGRLVTAANEAAHATRGLAQAGARGPELPGPATSPGPPSLPGPTARSDHPTSAPERGDPYAAPEIAESIDALQALAAGMRELTS